jgi:hypothetical protein
MNKEHVEERRVERMAELNKAGEFDKAIDQYSLPVLRT